LVLRSLACLFALAAAGLAAPPAGAAAGAAAPLRWKLEKGTALRYRMTADQTASEDLGRGEPFETRQKSAIVYRLEVADVEPTGSARVLCRYESVAIDMDQMMIGHVVWDSAKQADAARANDPIVKPFAQLVGKEFNFRMSPVGEVSDVRGYDEIAKAVLRGVEDNKVAQAALAAGFGQEAVRAALGRAFAVLPPEGADERWERRSEQEIPLLGTLCYETSYAVEPAAAGGARAITAKTVLAVAGPAAGAAGAEEIARALEIEWRGGKGEARILFAADLGRLVSSESTLEMALRSRALPPVAPEDGPNAVAADVRVRQTVKVELLDRE
jgi:hypothetical protein